MSRPGRDDGPLTIHEVMAANDRAHYHHGFLHGCMACTLVLVLVFIAAVLFLPLTGGI